METQAHEAADAARQALKAKIQIYDMDAHVIESDDDLRPLMPEPYRNKQGPLLGMDEWHVRVRRRPRAPGDLEKRLAVMKEEGIAYSLLFPSRAMDVGTQRDKNFAIAFCRAYNDYIASVCREAAQLRGVALLPFHDPAAAVSEIKRAVTELELSGVVLSSFGLKEHIGSATYWPIYQEMERLDVPLMIHASIQGPTGDRRADSFLLQHTVGRPVATLYDCAALIYGGVVENFPKLRVAFLENRAAWVPYWMDYLDAKWEKRRADAPLLKQKPSAYMTGGNLFYSAEPEEKSLPHVLDRIGADLIIFATDYPHSGSAFTADLLDRTDISDEAKSKILHDNGKRLFGCA
ncbi:MAG: amidohydrolase family protein [Candidatus Binatia bacterium]